LFVTGGCVLVCYRGVCTCLLQGGWVLLQNCHLGLNYLDELLETISAADAVNESFRIWITTEVHPDFSIGLLQVCPHCFRSYNISTLFFLLSSYLYSICQTPPDSRGQNRKPLRTDKTHNGGNTFLNNFTMGELTAGIESLKCG